MRFDGREGSESSEGEVNGPLDDADHFFLRMHLGFSIGPSKRNAESHIDRGRG